MRRGANDGQPGGGLPLAPTSTRTPEHSSLSGKRSRSPPDSRSASGCSREYEERQVRDADLASLRGDDTLDGIEESVPSGFIEQAVVDCVRATSTNVSMVRLADHG